MTSIETFEPVGEHDRRLALSARGALGAFNRAGVLTAADVHIARTLARVTREQEEDAVIAVALASRAVRSGSVGCPRCSVGRVPPADSLRALPRNRNHGRGRVPGAARLPDREIRWRSVSDGVAAVRRNPGRTS